MKGRLRFACQVAKSVSFFGFKDYMYLPAHQGMSNSVKFNSVGSWLVVCKTPSFEIEIAPASLPFN